MADAELYAFPTMAGADGSLNVTTWGETFRALVVLLRQGKIAEAVSELEYLARDYDGVEIAVLPQDR